MPPCDFENMKKKLTIETGLSMGWYSMLFLKDVVFHET